MTSRVYCLVLCFDYLPVGSVEPEKHFYQPLAETLSISNAPYCITSTACSTVRRAPAVCSRKYLFRFFLEVLPSFCSKLAGAGTTPAAGDTGFFNQSTKRRNEVVTSVVVTHSDLGEGEASNPPGHFDMVHTAF